MTIVRREAVRAAFDDEVRRGAGREDALQTTADALALPIETVREVVSDEPQEHA
jgi:hypothetical protein